MKKQIILVVTGQFQKYIFTNIKQLLTLGFVVHVILDLPFFPLMKEYETQVTLIDAISLKTIYDEKTKLGKGFWKYCSKRLFLVYEYMKKENLQNVIHLENDVLLYSTMDYPFDEKIYLTMDAPNRCIPGIIFIPNYKLLTNLVNNYDFAKNDMVNMAMFFRDNKDIVKTFPIIDDSVEVSMYNENFNEFNSIFDGAAIGQYVGGTYRYPDVAFVNETCQIKYDRYTFEWVKKDKFFLPYIKINDKRIFINNLHIHSKNLEKFSIYRLS